VALAEFHLNNQNALGKQMSLMAIVPETSEGPFPVLYLLHGLSDDHTQWTRITSIERYVAGLPLIAIMPNGERGFYSDNLTRPNALYETYFIKDIVGFTDLTFKTIGSSEGRVVAGLSMGGYGAAKFAVKYPDLICAAASLSGAMEFSRTDRADDKFLLEFGPVAGPN
jgi:putative tributyrin esterase